MRIIVRKAMSSDVHRLLEIQKKAFLVQALKYDAYDIPPMVEEEGDVKIDSPGWLVLVAEADGILAGSIRAEFGRDDAEIKRLSVDDSYQNMGIGSLLMHEIEKHCAGLKRIWLFTGGQSEKNIRLYEKLGYNIFREEPFKDGFTLVHMEKFLQIDE
ncbi:MAG: GNAT family N-acetyltransferase [Clostridia bacterium]